MKAKKASTPKQLTPQVRLLTKEIDRKSTAEEVIAYGRGREFEFDLIDDIADLFRSDPKDFSACADVAHMALVRARALAMLIRAAFERGFPETTEDSEWVSYAADALSFEIELAKLATEMKSGAAHRHLTETLEKPVT